MNYYQVQKGRVLRVAEDVTKLITELKKLGKNVVLLRDIKAALEAYMRLLDQTDRKEMRAYLGKKRE